MHNRKVVTSISTKVRLRTLLLAWLVLQNQDEEISSCWWVISCGFDDTRSDGRAGMDVDMALVGLTVGCDCRIWNTACGETTTRLVWKVRTSPLMSL